MIQHADGNIIAVTDLVKIYAGRKERVRAVDGVSFAVEPGQFYTLLGPSGCGKTTTLRCVAGLERPDDGQIRLAGELVSSGQPRVFEAAHKRNIGMVFQSYAIWPHLTVFENVAFPLRVGKSKLSGAVIRRKVEEALEIVQLGEYVDRMATQLSGGQQQRLALARALVRQPSILLLDEPLSNLDAKLRERMRTEVRDIQRRLGITALYVTHDQVEALSMSSRIAVMSNGKIVQAGTPREIYQHPSSRFVADFVGSANFLDAEVQEFGVSGLASLTTPLGVVQAFCPPGVARGETVTLSIRPENLVLHATKPAAFNVFEAEVSSLAFLGEMVECRLRVGGAELMTRQHPNAALRVGDRPFVELPDDRVAVLTDRHGVTFAGTDTEARTPLVGVPAASAAS